MHEPIVKQKMMNDLLKKHQQLIYLVLCALLWIVVSFSAITLNYVEGDDAASIAYHALGRNNNIQPQYAHYHGMMDKILSLLPPLETPLRKVSLILTFICSIYLIIISTLLGLKITKKPLRNAPFIILVSLLVVPELFYWGLVYGPFIIGASFIFTAHYIILSKQFSITSLIIGALFFGVGVAIRWDLGFYLGVIVLLYLTYPNTKFNLKILGVLILTFLASSLLFIFYSGAGFHIIMKYQSLKDYYADKSITNFSVLSLVGNITWTTPALLVIILYAIKYTFSIRWLPLVIYAGVIMLPIIGYGIFGAGTLKRIIILLPLLSCTIIVGTEWLFLKNALYLKMLFIAILFLPWAIGVQVINNQTAWGPDFSYYLKNKSDNVLSYKIAFNTGTPFITEEGPRPIWGFFHNLLFDWKHLNKKWNNDKKDLLALSLKYHKPIIQEKETPYIVCYLSEMGYKTNDPATQNFITVLTRDKYAKRLFTKKNSSVNIYNYQGDYKNDFGKTKQVKEMTDLLGDSIFVNLQYSSVVSNFEKLDTPFHYHPYTPFTGIIYVLRQTPSSKI